ncbi:hypothetical protein Syun_016281 [Stephania yunnanensis]|uniref:Uncharacterized protein n=1 Tax=Stephania yunnanensis TaxID=152371 RepID=A0AAP0J4R0_9MAGN
MKYASRWPPKSPFLAFSFSFSLLLFYLSPFLYFVSSSPLVSTFRSEGRTSIIGTLVSQFYRSFLSTFVHLNEGIELKMEIYARKDC